MKKQNSLDFIEELYSTIGSRARSKKKNSYTNLLLKKGKNKIAQKIGEESTELIIDYLNGYKKKNSRRSLWSNLSFISFVLLKKNINQGYKKRID